MSLHVECGRAGYGAAVGGVHMPLEMGGSLAWSETLPTSPGVTTNAVPASNGMIDYVLTLTAEVDMWVSLAQTPDATVTTRRRRLKAGVTRSFAAAPGIKVAWSSV